MKLDAAADHTACELLAILGVEPCLEAGPLRASIDRTLASIREYRSTAGAAPASKASQADAYRK